MRALPRPDIHPARHLPARLLGTGSHLPERIVGNDEIARECGVDPAWIVARTGILERRRAADDQASSDLGAAAAHDALERAGVAAADVDLVICATCSPDHLFPSTAALIARSIGARGAGAFDLQAGCAGFVYGVVLAAQSVSSGTFKRVLVVGADVVSRMADKTDRSTAPIFGDGAGAAIFGPASGDEGLDAALLGADGDGADLLHMPGGGSRQPDSGPLGEGGRAIHMIGPALFRSAVRHSVAAALRVLDEAGVAADDVDLVVPHQSSRRLIEATARGCGVPLDRVAVNLERYGNTACASLPIALHEAVSSGRAPAGSSVLLLGFGAGLSWGAGLLRT